MVVSSARASARMAWMSLAKLSMDDSAHWGSRAYLVSLPSGQCARETSSERPMALANEVAAWEATATLDCQPSRVSSGIGYRKKGLWGVLPAGRQSRRGRDRKV